MDREQSRALFKQCFGDLDQEEQLRLAKILGAMTENISQLDKNKIRYAWVNK